MNDVSKNFKYNPYDEVVAKRLIELEEIPKAIKYFIDKCDGLTDYAYWFMLSSLWVSYSGFSDLEAWKKLFSSNRAKKIKSIMKSSEVEKFEYLPWFITVYRAHRQGEKDWIAYTLNKEIAFRFAKERGVNSIKEYRVKKRDVTALFLRREEEEIIILDKNKAEFIRDHIAVNENITLSPWKQEDKGYVALPLKRNIPDPKNKDWKLVECSICGEECWESDLARKVLETEGMKSACTMCSLKQNM